MVSATVLAIYENMRRWNATDNGKSVAVGGFILNVFLIVPPGDVQPFTTDLILQQDTPFPRTFIYRSFNVSLAQNHGSLGRLVATAYFEL